MIWTIQKSVEDLKKPDHTICVIFNDSYIQSVICKTINYRTSPLRIHHSYSYIETTPLQWRVTKFWPIHVCLTLTAFEHGRNFIMQHLLWHMHGLGFCGLVQNTPTLVTLNNKPLGTEHLSNPDSNGHMGREHTCIC